jgi:hypothetical protein
MSSFFGGGRRMMRTPVMSNELAAVSRSVLGSGATSPFTARVTPPELRIVTICLARRPYDRFAIAFGSLLVRSKRGL